jgi:cation diffusion facilitator family transporter
VFLLIADRRGSVERDDAHPLGYGRETYFWSTIAAFGLFTAGAVLSVVHGIQELSSHEGTGEFWVNYLVLGISAIFESISFRQALHEARAAAKEQGSSVLSHVLDSSNPTLRAVFAEDSAALVGLGIALIGIVLHQVTGNPFYDALGSILIGALLGVVAVILIERNRRFLVGQATSPQLNAAVLGELLARDDIDRVTYIHLEFVGPGRVFLVAAVDLTGNEPEEDVALTLRRIERDIEINEHVQQAVLTLSTPDDPALTLPVD